MSIQTRVSPADVLATPLSPGRLSRLVFETSDVELRHYAPGGEDKQVPHDRDELYFVISGNGIFLRGNEQVAFGPGDVLYAAAGETHCFIESSAGFSTWVVFYGPRKAL